MTKATIAVELVADQTNFQDRLYGTDIVWLHKGDVKHVPEALWPKFAKHPDVYTLAHPVTAAEADRQEALKTAAKATETLDAVVAEHAAEQKEAIEQKQAAVGDVKPLFVTAEQLEPLPDDAIRKEGAARGYKLHPNLSAANLRARFIDQQAADPSVSKPD